MRAYLVGYDTLAWQDASGWSYPVPDALGSVRQVVDATGELVDARERTCQLAWIHYTWNGAT